ncbi:DnaJ C-terminal domain-containing protein [Roseibium sp. RKSG952]|uniref:DnaJ C-terminal domain-containing protein n=1 Tax=Roseibium sp. RKSG952 TaxID=2529384 RepID=UPI0018AD101A|nr:DnaJ C-terminal domain-containing protein [Roseibium sp. RKSG952]
MNPFKVLDLPTTATADDAKARFRHLVKETHSDKTGRRVDGAWLASIKQARDSIVKLRDEEASPCGTAKSRSSVESGFSRSRKKSPVRRDRRIEMNIPLADALRGGGVRIRGASRTCLTCEGAGKIRTSHRVPCETCGGRGVSATAARGRLRIFAECSDCGGTGNATKYSCPECGGYGAVSFGSGEIAIPPGTRDGDLFMIRGGASDPEKNVIGDLEVVIKLLMPSRDVKISGDDVYCRLPLEVWDASLGCTVSFPAPDGIEYTVTVPAGTSGTDRLRLKGLGLVREDGRGDVVLIPTIKMPDVSDANVRRALEALKKNAEG